MRRIFICCILACVASLACFGQASAVREYVGMIGQTFHPDIVSFMQQYKNNLTKRGHSNAARSVERFLKGDSGTGFVFVAKDGTNYIITNYHVISLAHTLSVTFENVDGEITMFSNLTIVAADEDMDIALLTFAEGQNPFRQGLAFLPRTIQEGDDVYSAGFPGLGSAMIWQFGRGMVSNASVRLPDEDEPGKYHGPYIQHTAQVDPGNSGGPLLVQVQGVPTGFAVAGINTLSARFRQAANYSIPMNRVQTFLDANIGTGPKVDVEGLEERITSFLRGIRTAKAIYPHIAGYLSNSCTAENADFALSEMVNNASQSVQNDIVETFVHSPIEGMAHAVAWTIENAIRPKAGNIAMYKDSVVAEDDNSYTVTFMVNGSPMTSKWTNEYGIWRIRAFGDFAAGNKQLIRQKRKEAAEAARLVDKPSLRLSANFVNVFDPQAPVLGLDLKFGFAKGYAAWGFQFFFRPSLSFDNDDYTQFEFQIGTTIPITVGKMAFIPFVDAGAGALVLPDLTQSWNSGTNALAGISVKGGVMFTTAAVPGLYLHVAYQYGFYKDLVAAEYGGEQRTANPNMLIIGIGFSR